MKTLNGGLPTILFPMVNQRPKAAYVLPWRSDALIVNNDTCANLASPIALQPALPVINLEIMPFYHISQSISNNDLASI